MSDQSAPAKRRRKWPWVLLGLFVLFVVIAIANGPGTSVKPGTVGVGGSPATPSAAPAAPAGDPPVTFEVTGDSKVQKANTIDYGAMSSQSQANGKSLPWRKEVPAGSGFEFYTLTAQSASAGDGKITCTIRQGDRVITTNSSEGGYAVVTCSGSS